ncbi:hypothetical protein Tco_0286466 [Tanacetum coccineum]
MLPLSSSTSSPSNNSFEIQQLGASLEDKMNIKMNQMMKEMKALVVTNSRATPSKAVEEVCGYMWIEFTILKPLSVTTRGKDNGENIMKSNKEGPFQMGTVSDVITGRNRGFAFNKVQYVLESLTTFQLKKRKGTRKFVVSRDGHGRYNANNHGRNTFPEKQYKRNGGAGIEEDRT